MQKSYPHYQDDLHSVVAALSLAAPGADGLGVSEQPMLPHDRASFTCVIIAVHCFKQVATHGWKAKISI